VCLSSLSNIVILRELQPINAMGSMFPTGVALSVQGAFEEARDGRLRIRSNRG
jgi:hypothetical protein